MTAYAGPILIVTGILTVLGGAGFISPRFLLDGVFGVSSDESGTVLLARHWSLLIGLVGGILIYAGYHPEVRGAAMVLGAAEKLVLGALVAASPLRKRPVTVAIVAADAVMALTYVALLLQR